MDKLTPDRRSENMRRIKSKGTKPEMLVRRLVHGMGYRYRLHAGDLPGKPDLVFRPRRKAIFVHGCFWHGHDSSGCPDRREVKSNAGYWTPKIARNRERDQRQREQLEAANWRVMVVWECETTDPEALKSRLRDFLDGVTSD